MTKQNLWTSWTAEDDNTLLSIVLQALRVGKPRTYAFQITAEKLGRTQESVAYRWNTKIGKENKELVDKAILYNKKKKQEVVQKFTKEDNKIHLSDVIQYIELVEQENKELQKENEMLRQKIKAI